MVMADRGDERVKAKTATLQSPVWFDREREIESKESS